MKNHCITVFLAVFSSLVLFSGCVDKMPRTGEQQEGPDAASPVKAGSKAPEPDENELAEKIKTALWKQYFTELPYEVSVVTVEWGEKDELAYTGNYTAVIKAKEKLYQSIPNSEGRRKLLEKEYEGELKVAHEKANGLPEYRKTSLLESFPSDDLRQLEFYEIVLPKGGEQKIRGKVELTREDMEDPFKVASITKRTTIESAIPDSELNARANRLDDEETSEKLERIVNKRKNWIADVKKAIEEEEENEQAKLEKAREIERERLAARKKQLVKFFQPGAKYEGSSIDHEASPSRHDIVVEFGDYEMPDQTIYGRYYNPAAQSASTTFLLTLTLTGNDGASLDVDAPLEGVLKEHKNPQGLNGVPRYYSSFDHGRQKVYLGFHEDNLLFRVGNAGQYAYFRGELKPIAPDKTINEKKTEK